MDNNIENKGYDREEPTERYMHNETVVEVYGELDMEVFAKVLFKLFTKKGINVYEDN